MRLLSPGAVTFIIRRPSKGAIIIKGPKQKLSNKGVSYQAGDRNLFLEGGGLALRLSYGDVQSTEVHPEGGGTGGELVLHLSHGTVMVKDCDVQAAFDLSALVEGHFR
jgi:hypothetical protein